MESRLFLRALATLTPDEQARVSQMLRQIRNFTGNIDGLPVAGKRLAENVATETRMTGDADLGDSSEFATFLKLASDTFGADEADGDVVARFGRVCKDFSGRGLAVRRQCVSEQMLRYTMSRKIASAIIRRVLGVGAQLDFDTGRLPPDQAFVDLAEFWSSGSVGPDENLGSGPLVFATFEESAAPLDRNDVEAVANALALPVALFDDREGLFLYELVYDAARVQDIRFPTVADAGTLDLFRPCEDVDPHLHHPRACFGMTRALAGEADQPEVTHKTASCSVLAASPRYVGSFDE